MSIGLSQLSAQRVDLIRHAESLEQATEMGFIDGLIDKIFRGGAKREAIVELYSVINQNKGDTGTQMRALLDMRSLILPEHRGELQLSFTENPNGSCNYTLTLGSRVLDEREGITDEAAIASLRHAANAIKVDDYLLRLQDFAPDAASLVQRSDRFLVQQGRTGDCYMLAALIGIMANPVMQETIEQRAEITAEGKLRLKFDANMSAQLTESVSTLSSEEVEKENFDSIMEDSAELASLREKGYDLAQEDGLLRLDISEDQLKRIIGETRSAGTNSLIVNILEHFVGNLLPYEEFVPATSLPGEDFLALHKSKEELNQMKMALGTTQLHPLRSDREYSILGHNDRAGNYSSLVTNLLGYQTGSAYRDMSVPELSKALTNIDQNERCLMAGGKNGFVYVGMDYGETDEFGEMHGSHALVLQDLVLHADGEVEGVFLINPWGNKREPEYYTLKELVERNVVLREFTPPGEAPPLKPNTATAPSEVQSPSLDAAAPQATVSGGNSNTTFVLFDQFA